MKMVPSDPLRQPVLHPACSDWTWQSRLSAVAPLLPATGFLPVSGSTLQSPTHTHLDRSLVSSKRPFTPLHRTAPCDALRSRIDVPDLLLRLLLNPFHDPFGLATRCRFHDPDLLWLTRPPPLPVRVFRPFRLVAPD